MAYPAQESQDQDPSQTPEGQDPPQESPEAPQDQAPSDQDAAPADGEERPEETSGDPAPGAPKPEGHRRAGGFQRKIDRLERQNLILLDQLQRAGIQPPTAAPAAAPKTDAEKAVEYIDKLVAQKLAAVDQQRQAQTVQAEFQRRTAEARAKLPDFDDVLDEARHLHASPALQHALLTSERGPEIMYELAKNPAELARISALPPFDAAREVGRLEARASGATPQTPKPAARPPAPPSKVNGSASSTRRLEDLPLSEYKAAHRSGRR